MELGLKTQAVGEDDSRAGLQGGDGLLRQGRRDGALDALGFYLAGYGCTTCIGNSGPLPQPISNAIEDEKLIVCAVLSGNRNFEGRVNPHTRFNYLASPPLVVAYALAGRMDIDFATEPLGVGTNGPVFLRDMWPTPKEVRGHGALVDHERDVPQAIRQRVRRRRAVARSPCPPAPLRVVARIPRT